MTAAGFHFDNTYARLPETLYTKLAPAPAAAPEIVILNDRLAAGMGLDFSGMNAEEQAALFSGNALPEGAEPLAQAYAGHQFGSFTMLGDGRAHVWGEHITPDGGRFDIQFKGSGRTPYSRMGDGRAALGPMLREYLISEAMHALNIPTTRSLAVVKTGEDVARETMLPGAVLTRVASSHIRVGTFEYAAARQDIELLQTLVDYTLERHFPALAEQENKALALLEAVSERQADLVTHWMRAGFIHGVMNTDNMALSGETIDYGPCAFMDAFHPATVFSSIDMAGRYAYGAQPVMAQWNLARFAEALLPLIHEDENKAVKLAEERVNAFAPLYQEKWLDMMRAKLGLFGRREEDSALVGDLLDWMQREGADYTNTFRDLRAEAPPPGKPYDSPAFRDWHKRWRDRLAQNTKPLKSAQCLMRAHNPAVIPRNHMVEAALAAGVNGDMKPFHDMLDALKEPYADQPEHSPYTAPPPPSERVYQTFCGT